MLELFTILSQYPVFEILFALHSLALIIVNLTPTPKDNEILGKVYKVIELLAGIFSRTAKELPGERGVLREIDAIGDSPRDFLDIFLKEK